MPISIEINNIYPKTNRPTTISQKAFKIPPNAKINCPITTKVAYIQVPSLIPKTRSIKNPPKKHEITFGHEYSEYNNTNSDVVRSMSL